MNTLRKLPSAQNSTTGGCLFPPARVAPSEPDVHTWRRVLRTFVLSRCVSSISGMGGSFSAVNAASASASASAPGSRLALVERIGCRTMVGFLSAAVPGSVAASLCCGVCGAIFSSRGHGSHVSAWARAHLVTSAANLFGLSDNACFSAAPQSARVTAAGTPKTHKVRPLQD